MAVAAGAAVGVAVGAVLAVRLEPARHEGGPHRHKSSRQMILQIADTLARLDVALNGAESLAYCEDTALIFRDSLQSRYRTLSVHSP